MRNSIRLIVVLASLITCVHAFAESERYCNGLGEFAKGYVEDRDAGQSYQVALSSVFYTLRDAKLPSVEATKWRRDLNTTIRWVHKDFPKLSQDGAYKLIRAACLQDDLK